MFVFPNFLFKGSKAKCLSAAVKAGDIETVRKVLSAATPAIVNHLHKDGNTALIVACREGRTEIVKLLLACPDIDVNLCITHYATYTTRFDSALSVACVRGHIEIVKLLLASPRIDVNLTPHSNPQALVAAARGGHIEIMKLLLACSKLQKDLRNTALIEAADCGHVEVVKLLLACPGIQVNTLNHSGTALYKAVENAHLEVVKLLLAHPQIKVNRQAEEFDTVLHNALGYKSNESSLHVEIMKLLLARPEIDVNARSKFENETALMSACGKYNTEFAKLLLARQDVNIDLKDKYGRTALMLAKENCLEDIVKILQERTDLKERSERERQEKQKKLEWEQYNKKEKERMRVQREKEVREEKEAVVREAREKKERQEKLEKEQQRERERKAEAAKLEALRKATPTINTIQRAVESTSAPTNTNTNTNNSRDYHPTYGYPYRRLVANTHARGTLTPVLNVQKNMRLDIWVGIFIPDNAPTQSCYTQGGTLVGNTLVSGMPEIVIQTQYAMVEVSVQWEAIEFNGDMTGYTTFGYQHRTITRCCSTATNCTALHSRNFLSDFGPQSTVSNSWKVGTPFKVTEVKISTNTFGYYTETARYSSPYQEIGALYERGVVLELMDSNTQGNYAADLLYGNR